MSSAIGMKLPDKVLEHRARNRKFRSYAAIIGFVLFTAVGILGHDGSVLNYAFPLLATCLAGFLFAYRRSTYVAYTWWIWLASPEVRRLVDYQSGYHNVSPVMVAPLLVTGFAVLAVLRRPRVLLQRSMLPFGLIAIVTVLAFFIGALTNGFFSAAFEWISWLDPLFFCVFLLMDKTGVQENRAALVNAIIVGLFIIGAYGIYQFFHFPAWDAFWLNNSKLTSVGTGASEQVRVFGPLNSPGVYGFVLMASLVFMLVAKGPLKILAGAVGFPAFLLSEVRSAWGAWFLAAIFVFWRLGGKARVRLSAVAVIIAALALPILVIGPVADQVTKRLTSVSAVQQDKSAIVRESLFEYFFVAAISQPIGTGFGALGVSAKLTGGENVDFDSGILEIPLLFGWVGGIVFIWAIFRILMRVLASYLKSTDPITTAACATFFGLLSGILFGQIFEGPQGLIVWVAVALALSSANGPERKMGQRGI